MIAQLRLSIADPFIDFYTYTFMLIFCNIVPISLVKEAFTNLTLSTHDLSYFISRQTQRKSSHFSQCKQFA
jgi:hypothetical protein